MSVVPLVRSLDHEIGDSWFPPAELVKWERSGLKRPQYPFVMVKAGLPTRYSGSVV